MTGPKMFSNMPYHNNPRLRHLSSGDFSECFLPFLSMIRGFYYLVRSSEICMISFSDEKMFESNIFLLTSVGIFFTLGTKGFE